MKSPLTAVVLAAAVLSSLAFARPAQKATLEERVNALEVQLAERATADLTAATEVAELKELVQATVAYLEAQASAAAEMERTLAASEKAGFTYGINPESREILLSGWRERLATMQTNVPGRKKEPEAANATRGRRR